MFLAGKKKDLIPTDARTLYMFLKVKLMTKNVRPKALPVLSLPISHSNAYLRVVYCYWAGSFPQAAVFLSLQFLWTLMVFLGLITTVWHLSVGGHILYQQVQSLTQTPTSKVLLLFFKPSC